MPDVKFKCPKCSQSLEAPDDMAGQVAECPSCRTSVRIPQSKLSRPPTPNADPGKTRRNWTPLVVIAIVVGLAVISVALVFTIMRKQKPNVSPMTAPIALSQEQKDKERDSRLSRVKVTIKGGAWVERKSGNSEILRGLKIYLLKAKSNNQQLSLIHQALSSDAQSNLKSAQDDLAFRQKVAACHPDNEFSQQNLKVSAAKLKLFEALLKKLEADAQTSAQADPAGTVDLKEIYSIVPETPTSAVAAAWVRVCGAQLAATTHTGVDGVYELPTGGGSFYLYAYYESDYSIVEWFLPVAANESGEIKLDFQNSNAAFIKNKSDK